MICVSSITQRFKLSQDLLVEICMKAIAEKDLEQIKYCFEKGLERTVSLCSIAASHGDLNILKFLREQFNCPWNSEVCEIAVHNKNFEMLKYVLENGCDWDKNICMNLIGDLDTNPMFQFAHYKHNYPDMNQPQCSYCNKFVFEDGEYPSSDY